MLRFKLDKYPMAYSFSKELADLSHVNKPFALVAYR